jgi:cytochrome c peroxidase
VKAIASYERTLVSGDSLFDRYLFGRDHSVLSASAERGLSVKFGEAFATYTQAVRKWL